MYDPQLLDVSKLDPFNEKQKVVGSWFNFFQESIGLKYVP